MNRIIDIIIDKYRYVLIAILLITLPMGYFYTKQTFNEIIDIYFDEDDPDIRYYRQFQKMYGNEEKALIIFKVKNIFTNEHINLIRELSEKIKDINGVQRLFSLTEAKEAIGKEETVTFEKIIPDRALTRQDLKAIEKKIMEDELLVKNLISEDGKATAILFELEFFKDYGKKIMLLKNVKDTAIKIAGAKVNLRFFGSYTDLDFNNLTQRDFMVFTPIIFMMIFCIAAFMLKQISLAIFCMITLIITHVWAFGFLISCGETLNMVTMLLSPVLLCVSIADAIHLMSRYRKDYAANDGNHIEAISTATKSIWLPCLFTSLTTGVGFFSFISASVRPVKMLGIFTCIGVMFALFLTITFIPAILIVFKKRYENLTITEEKKDSLFTKILIRIGNITLSGYKPITVIFVIIAIISIIGINKITYETNLSSYLSDNNPIKLDLDFFTENFGGTVPLILLIQARSAEYDFTYPSSLRILEKIQKNLVNNFEQITSAYSIVDYYKEINEAFNNGDKKYFKVPDKRIDVIDYYELGDEETMDRILAVDNMEARVTFRCLGKSFEETKNLMEKIKIYLNKNIGEHHTYKPTGINPLSIKMGYNLQKSMFRSFLSAFIVIFFMMWFICKNIKLTFLSMIPNLFPIFLTFGIMGWLNIPLDVVTIMIASVTIGIAIDDTIHWLVWFKRNMESGMDLKSSILKVYTDTGKPIAITTVILFLGFFVLILGSVKPTQAFGVLTAFAMLFALIGDFFILPAVIMIFKPKIGQKENLT